MSRGREPDACGRMGCTNDPVAYVRRDGVTVVVCGTHTDDGEEVGRV